MDYSHRDIGAALGRLRKAAGLRQEQLAAKIGRSGATVSRLEQPGSNPNASSLTRYLAAVGADFGELHREMREGTSDPLDDAVATVDQRLREDPSFRQLARGMLERFGGPEPPPALRALADLIDRQGDEIEQQAGAVRRQKEQMETYEGRLRKIEEQQPAEREEG